MKKVKGKTPEAAAAKDVGADLRSNCSLITSRFYRGFWRKKKSKTLYVSLSWFGEAIIVLKRLLTGSAGSKKSDWSANPVIILFLPL